jgi:hypothetical protein
MRSVLALSIACLLLVLASPAEAATGKIRKVLPFFLDRKGQHTASPSLFERDRYQALLRADPGLRSGLVYRVRYATSGKAAEPLRIRVQLRGIAQGNLPKEAVIEQPVLPSGWLGRWATLELTGEDFINFGEVTAWRVTLWEGDDLLLDQEQSFLW